MRLEGTEVFRGKPDLLGWHSRIIDLRHTYVSHSDDNEFEKSSLECAESDAELIISLQYHFSFPFDRLYELRDLIRYLDTYLVDHHKEHITSIERRIRKSVRIREGEQAIQPIARKRAPPE